MKKISLDVSKWFSDVEWKEIEKLYSNGTDEQKALFDLMVDRSFKKGYGFCVGVISVMMFLEILYKVYGPSVKTFIKNKINELRTKRELKKFQRYESE